MRLPSFGLSNLFSRSHGRNSDALLVVDIGTLYIRAALFTPDEHDESALVLRAHNRVAQREGTMHAGLLVAESTVLKSVHDVVETITEETGIRPKRLRIGAGGGVLFGRTVRKQYRRDDSQATVDERELLHMLQKIEWHAYEEIRKEFARETGRYDTDITILNARVTRALVDGYAVESPLGFRGQDVTMDVFHVYAPVDHVQALQAIAEAIEIDEWEIVAEYDAVAQILTTNDISQALLIDVGGVSTDMALVRDNAVLVTDTFAFGGRTLTQRIARHLQVGFEEAEDVKKQYSAGSLSANAKRKITMISKQDLEVWEQGITFALNTFARRYSPLPSQWFLYGGGSMFPKFKERLQNHSWGEGLPFVQDPTVQNFSRDLFENRVILQQKQEPAADTIGILAIALAHRGRSEKEDELNRQLRRVLRIIQS